MDWYRALHWGDGGALGHTWSLAIEEQFYFVWPLILLLVSRRKRLTVTHCLLIAAIGWRTTLWLLGAEAERLYNGFDTHADSLLAGCALAQISVPKELASRMAQIWFVPVAIIVALVPLLPYNGRLGLLIGVPVVSLLSVWIIIAASQGGMLRRFLSTGVAVFLGRISYGIYLWHYPMLFYLGSVLPHRLAILPVLGAVVVAVISWRWIEDPINRMKERFPAPGEANLGGTGQARQR